MKATGVCPKCKNERLLHVTQVADRVGDVGGSQLRHGLEHGADEGKFYPWRVARMKNHDHGPLISQVVAAGLVEAYVCRVCGLTELYTIDPEAIEVDGVLVKEVNGGPAYRG
jgi:predicted nucleic-acid-binding Zn-ribbon protein